MKTIYFAMAIFALAVTGRTQSAEPEVAVKLEAAFGHLKDGRTYRKGIKTTTQSSLVNNFLAGLNGDVGNIEAANNLRMALEKALEVRNSRDRQARFQEKGSRTAASLARTIADEALEAQLFGFLAVGNRDLINGTRLQFPGDTDALDPYKNLPPARHVTASKDSRRIIYDGGARKDLRSLEYARLYFLEGLIDALQTMRRDVDPRLRTIDTTSSYPLGWTKWNQHGDGSAADNADPSVTLPGFIDDDFESTDDQWSLTAGAQLGKLIRRYGGTVATIGDKLWRKAYQHEAPSAATANNAPKSEEYLAEAVEQLRYGMHAQYLASLPLAAVMSDGGRRTLSEYEAAKIADIVSAVDQSTVLMNKIQNAVRPLVIDIVEGWDQETVNRKAQDVREALAAAEDAWVLAEQKINESRNRDQAVASEKRLRRSNFQYRLWQISGIHPDDVKAPDGGADPLDTVGERQEYFTKVVAKAQELLRNYDPADPVFQNTLSGATFPDPLAELGQPGYQPNQNNTSELAFAALRFAQQIRSLKTLLKQYADVDREIAIIEGKTDRINQIDKKRHMELGAIEALIALISASQIEIGKDGERMIFLPGQVIRSLQAITTRMISATADAAIREEETDASVANLEIRKEQLAAQIPEINIGIRMASNEIERLLGEASQHLSDYAYYIDVLSDDLESWFYDPEIRFGKEAAEERYEQLVRSLQQEAYVLARHLEEAWLEEYEFPAINDIGAYEQYTTDVEGAAEFPDAEAVFIGLNHRKVRTFLAALKDWDEFLRGERFQGPGRLETKEISLRKQIFQLPDYRWDNAEERYVFDPRMEADSIRSFRALMVEAVAAGQNNGDGVAFRLEFSLDIGLFHEVQGVGTEPVFSNFDSRREWNRRITDVGIKFIGQNVSQGTPTEPGQIDATIFLHGHTRRRSGRNLPAAYDTSVFRNTDLTLYQYDPGQPGEEGKQLFVEDFNVLVGNSSEVVFNDNEFNSTSREVPEWPFNCDTWILMSRARANYDNITDIVLRIAYAWGTPKEFNLVF
jgi:hypothetical protein